MVRANRWLRDGFGLPGLANRRQVISQVLVAMSSWRKIQDFKRFLFNFSGRRS